MTTTPTPTPIRPVADTTVPMAPAGTSPTVVAPGTAAAAKPKPQRARQFGVERRVLVVCALGLLALFAAAAALNLRNHGRGTVAVAADQKALVEKLHNLAGRVHEGDGPQGPTLEKQLDAIADDLAAGKPAGDKATATLLAVKTWHDAHQLGDTAATEATQLLNQVPGVNAAPATTVAPPTTAPPPPTTAPHPPPSTRKHGKGRDKGGD